MSTDLEICDVDGSRTDASPTDASPTDAAPARRSRPARRAFSRTAAFWVVVGAYLTLMIAASVPSPLYVVFQQRWRFPTSTLTVVFGVYALALLLTLLTVGGLSDFVGRRPVLLTGFGLLAASSVLFACAQGVGWLYLARIVQGLGAGATIGTLSAGIVDLAPPGRLRLAALLNALVPAIGLGLGALVGGAFAEWAPHPTVVVFVVVAIALGAVAVALAFTPESGPPRSGALRSLSPRMRIARPVRGAFFRAAPGLIVAWAQMGLTLSLLVSVAAAEFAVTDELEAGLLVVAVCFAGAASAFALRDSAPARRTVFGALGSIVGTGLLLVALDSDTFGWFVAGAVVGGLGLGALMSGALATLTGLPRPEERGEFFAGVYVVGYLAFSIPVVAAGFAAVHVGLRTTMYVYGLGLIALALAALAAVRASASAPAGSPSITD